MNINLNRYPYTVNIAKHFIHCIEEPKPNLRPWHGQPFCYLCYLRNPLKIQHRAGSVVFLFFKPITINSSLSTDHMRLIKSEYVMFRLITKQLSHTVLEAAQCSSDCKPHRLSWFSFPSILDVRTWGRLSNGRDKGQGGQRRFGRCSLL